MAIQRFRAVTQLRIPVCQTQVVGPIGATSSYRYRSTRHPHFVI